MKFSRRRHVVELLMPASPRVRLDDMMLWRRHTYGDDGDSGG